MDFRCWRKPVWSSKWHSAVGGSSFGRVNDIPQLAEACLTEQMAFRSWRKLILSSKWHSAAGGSLFGRVNGNPLPAERNLVDQMALVSWGDVQLRVLDRESHRL